ncbi:hypothetical protein BGZ83_002886 [Gryganskiella cystojenkinii]|nr:hypothetical protein BGZ83_002886 [Gryganskiella cystojenkinii]
MPISSYIKNLVRPPTKTDDPRNWPRSKKNIVVFTIAYCAFIAPLASSIYMPAVLQVKEDLHTTESLVSASLSVYVLFMGIMPVFWASLCDYYGRRPIYLASMFIFILGSLLAALSKNFWVFFVMRAIQAWGSSSVMSVGGGSLSDIFHSGERGTAFGLFYVGPLIAPMIGPIIGGVMSDRIGWRSTMWLLLGTAVVAFLLVLFILPETYRKNIDPAPLMTADGEIETVEDEKDHSHSNVYSTHSDPTLVPSRSSLHNHREEASENAASSASASIQSVSAADSSPVSAEDMTSDNMSTQNGTHLESAKEFMVPNMIPIFLMRDEEENNSALSAKVESVDQGVSAIATSPAALVGRHVAFPEASLNEKSETENEAVVTVTVDAASEPKRKPFNPLRPLLCLREPTNAILVGFNGLALGAQFCMNNTLPISFAQNYHLSETTIGVCFCAGGLGSAMGSLIGGRYSDYVMRKWLIKQEVRRRKEERERAIAFGEPVDAIEEVNEKDAAAVVNISMRAPPEVRLQSVWLGVIVLPFGLMLFGWSVQNNLSIVAPLIGIACVGFGMTMVLSSTTTALVDANSDNNMATAAVACNSFGRGITGSIGGFVALPLLGSMGSGWLYTMWALITIAGTGLLIMMVVQAKSWRAKKAEKALNSV